MSKRQGDIRVLRFRRPDVTQGTASLTPAAELSRFSFGVATRWLEKVVRRSAALGDQCPLSSRLR